MDSRQGRKFEIMKPAIELLDESHGIIAARGQVYGDNLDTMDRTARLRSAMFGFSETSHKVAIDYVLGKLARIAKTQGPGNRDSYLDAICYLAIAYAAAVDESDNKHVNPS